MEKLVFVVRKAVEGDIPQIIEVANEAFRIYAEGAGITTFVEMPEETYEDLKVQIKDKLIFVALLGENVIGSVRVELKPDKTAYLSRFGVRGAFQSKGIGTILMDAVDKEMKELGITELYLHTASRMLSLVRFYYGRGFYIESTSKDRGYIRALLCKEYRNEITENSEYLKDENLAV